MESRQHELVIIGAGPGGYVAAIRAAQLGLDAAVVEQEERLGGTCLRVGCIPSKALLESSERFEQTRHEAEEHGFSTGEVTLNLEALMARKDRIVSELTGGVDSLMKKNKVTRYRGTAVLTGSGRVRITGPDQLELAAKHIVIATGSIPAAMPGIEFTPGLIGDSTFGLEFDSVPDRLAVIGAGYVGMEIGSVWNRLGSHVTVLEYFDRILPGIDSDLGHEAMRLYKHQGFDFRLGARVTGARAVKSGGKQHCVVESEGHDPVECDRVLVVVGRKPNTAGLGLSQVGIELDGHGFIPVDERFKTSVEGVYAIGDVIGGRMLAHKASHEGIACIECIAGGHCHVNYDAIPYVVYTDPEIAGVGRTEDELEAAGREYAKGVSLFHFSGRAKAQGRTDGRVKVLADAATDRLLGVHIIGPHAGELIAECTQAMEFGATSEDIARTCHAHPTLSETVMEAALAVNKRSIHS